MPKKTLPIILLFLIILLVTQTGRNVFLAAFMIPNLLPENQTRPLQWTTSDPKIADLDIPYKDGVLKATLYLPRRVKKTILAIHGANERGKDDPRIKNFGETFARSGMATLVPTFPNITREKFTPGANGEVKAAYTWLAEKYPDQKNGMIAFSVAAGPMFIAAADFEINEKVDYLISFGGYYELKEVLRNATIGIDRDPFGHELIANQYKKFFGSDESLDNLLDNTDPAKFDELFDALSPNIKQFIAELTPAQRLAEVKAEKVFLVHSDPDRIVPYTESERLKQALGTKAELTILRSFSHVNVQLSRPTPKNIINYYTPEAWKLYRLMFRILNY